MTSDLCLVCGEPTGDGGVVHVVTLGDGSVDDRLPLCATHEAEHRGNQVAVFDDEAEVAR